MKSIITLGILIVSINSIQAQINAVTDTGEEVVLYDDGTWKYANEGTPSASKIKTNEKIFTKDKNSSFIVKSTKVDIGIWINPKDWTFTKGISNEDAEFQFQKKGEDLYGMLIAEKLQIPIETLKNIALQNAKNASSDIKVVSEEYRTVNGIKVLMMQMAGTIQGLKVAYIGYYYSNESGTIQLLTNTGENLLKDYRDDIDVFLNGLVKL